MIRLNHSRVHSFAVWAFLKNKKTKNKTKQKQTQIQWLYEYVANWLTLEWFGSQSSINSYLAFYIFLFPFDVSRFPHMIMRWCYKNIQFQLFCMGEGMIHLTLIPKYMWVCLKLE